MKEITKAVNLIIEHIESVTECLEEEEINNFIDIILESDRVYVAGAGRSGLIAKAFAMRLMHLDIRVHVIGETITPRLKEENLFLAVSGSGETELIVGAAKKAKEIGAKIGVITSYPESTLGKLADLTLRIPGRTEKAKEKGYTERQISGEYESLTPLGTLFEDTTLTVLDGVIAGLIKKLGKREKDLNEKHASVE